MHITPSPPAVNIQSKVSHCRKGRDESGGAGSESRYRSEKVISIMRTPH